MKKLLFLLAALIPSGALAQPSSNRPPLRIQDNDGSPACYPWRLDVTNGSLTCNSDGTADLVSSGGGGGSSTLAVGTGTVTNHVIITSPTANIVGSNTDFKGSAIGGATFYLELSTNVARLDRNQTWHQPQTLNSSTTLKNLLGGTTVSISDTYQINGQPVLSVPNQYNLYVGTNTGNVATALASTLVGNGAGEFSGASATGLTSVGYRACRGVASGDGVGGSTTCMGYEAGLNLNGGNRSLFIGTRAGRNVSTGNDNICIGDVACDETTIGSGNVNIGNFSRSLAAANNYSTLVGDNVTATGDGNTCVGKESCAANGDNNTALGRNALITTGASKAVAIGYGATAPASNTMKLGGESADSVRVIMTTMTASSATITAVRVTNLTGSRCVETDANNNLVSAAAACGTGTGGGGDFKVSLSTGLLANTTFPAQFLVQMTTVTASSASFTSASVGGSLVCRADGTNCPSTLTGANYSQSFTGQTNVTLTHSLNTLNVIPQCYDSLDRMIFPSSLTVTGVNTINVEFSPAATGRCVVNGGAGSGGSGGGFSLAVATGTVAGFGTTISSSNAQAVLNFSSNTFSGQLVGGATTYINLKFLAEFRPEVAHSTQTANFCVPTRSTNTFTGYLACDASTREDALWSAYITPHYSGGSLAALVKYSMASATTGDVVFEARIACVSDGDEDIDNPSFAAPASATSTVPGTAGYTKTAIIPLTNDSCAVGDEVILYLPRDSANTSDTASGDSETRRVVLYEY